MKNTEKKIQAIAICGCLCLLAVGAGVTYRAFDRREPAAVAEQADQPVTAVQSPTIAIAAAEKNQRSNDPGEEPAPEEKQPVVKKQAQALTFSYPLQGEVVLPYSIDHAIYDPTLEQYRTNASVSLSAERGAEVKAAAAGTVQAVTEDAEMGNTITIAHENGWLTTYGQLNVAVAVKEGERVAKGQVIGSVERSTKYGAALGTHLEFAMAQNGQPRDPAEYLK